jgi:LacI family repressor for deo operon, udp, cdd, tsx, nupC, and nupG
VAEGKYSDGHQTVGRRSERPSTSEGSHDGRRQPHGGLPTKKRVTITDVASALGVSTATVSRALNGDPAISSATTRAVVEMSARVGYRPSAAARRLRTKATSLIGVVVQSVGDGYIGDVVLGVQSRARDFGYQPLLFASDGRAELETEAIEVFLNEQVSNVIAVSPVASPRLLRWASEEGLHIAIVNWDVAVPEKLFQEVVVGPLDRAVRFTRTVNNHPMSTITFDDEGAGRLATSHLLELGHRSFVHLRGPNVRSSLLRFLGYRRALEAAHLWPQRVLSAPLPTLESRGSTLAEYLRDAVPPVGLVAYDDLSAVAALRVAQAGGWRVPQDLSIVGIDDIQFAAYTNPGLSTVAQPKQELGALAVELLLDLPVNGPRARLLDGRLVVRESTASPAALSLDR